MTPRSPDKEDVVRIQSYIRDEIDKDRLRRAQREKKKNDGIEEALRRLSTFDYAPVDYSAGLIRKIFTAPAIPDYSYLLTEARLKAVNKYNAPIVFQSALGLVCVIASLAFRDTVVPIFGAAGLLACALSIHRDLGNRQRGIHLALTAARCQIDALIKEARDNIENNRRAFEEAEDARIGRIEKLLSGDQKIVFEKIEDVLCQIKLPFYLRFSVDFYKEPVITLHLPDQSIIPAKLVFVTSAGTIEYEDKSSFQINRQYSEALAGAALNIAAALYSHIPTLNAVYIQGLFDKWQEEEYFFSLRLTRQQLIDATACHSGFEAFQTLGAVHDLKTSGSFSPIQPLFPDWWYDTPKEKVRSFKIACKELY